MTEHFDAVIIGMGPGGEVAAGRLLEAGLRVAVIERELIGGECGYWACIPSKTLLRPVELVREARATPGVRVEDLDWDEVRRWRDDMVRHLDDAAQVASYRQQGATVIKGVARVPQPGVVEVDGRRLTAEHIVLATGSTPVRPDLEGLDACTVWTSREATSLRDIPGRAVVLGAGAVAVEVSQYLTGFGADVAVVGRGPRLLRREDPRVGELIAAHLGDQGIDLRLGAAATRAVRRGQDSAIELDDGSTVAGDVIVLATGRRPRTDSLDAAALGVRLRPDGGVEVDGNCYAGSGLWVVGDATGQQQLTHVAKYQARIAVAAILGQPRTANYSAIPRVVFGHPEVAAVGLTAEQARAADHRVSTAEVDLSAALARPWTFERQPAGAALGLIADADARVLLGAWAVAPMAGEWIHQAALAVGARVPLERLLDMVPQFPTFSEGYLTALESLR